MDIDGSYLLNASFPTPTSRHLPMCPRPDPDHAGDGPFNHLHSVTRPHSLGAGAAIPVPPVEVVCSRSRRGDWVPVSIFPPTARTLRAVRPSVSRHRFRSRRQTVSSGFSGPAGHQTMRATKMIADRQHCHPVACLGARRPSAVTLIGSSACKCCCTLRTASRRQSGRKLARVAAAVWLAKWVPVVHRRGAKVHSSLTPWFSILSPTIFSSSLRHTRARPPRCVPERAGTQRGVAFEMSATSTWRGPTVFQTDPSRSVPQERDRRAKPSVGAVKTQDIDLTLYGWAEETLGSGSPIVRGLTI